MTREVVAAMTREVVAVRGPTPFKELVRLLNEHRVTAVLVLDDPGPAGGAGAAGLTRRPWV